MGFFKSIRLRFHHRYLRQELQQQKRRPRSVNWDDAVNVGILFDATELSARQTALRYQEKLKSLGKQVRLLGFFDDDNSDPNFTFWHFNRKQFDWALRPTASEVREFIETAFDLLINIEPVTRLHSEYIAALSKAQLKVGPATDNLYSYDLMIEPRDRGHIEGFIQQIEGLLKITTTRNETAKI